MGAACWAQERPDPKKSINQSEHGTISKRNKAVDVNSKWTKRVKSKKPYKNEINNYSMIRKISLNPSVRSKDIRLDNFDDEDFNKRFSTQQNMISTEALHEDENMSIKSLKLSRIMSNRAPPGFNNKDRRESLNHLFASSFKVMKSKSIRSRK